MTLVLIPGRDSETGKEAWCPFWVEQKRLLLDEVIFDPAERPELEVKDGEFWKEHSKIVSPREYGWLEAASLCEKYSDAKSLHPDER